MTKPVRVLSVLIVSATDKGSQSIASLLSPTEFDPVVTVSSVGEARCIVQERDFDIIVINAPLRDESGIDFAIDMTERSFAGILLALKAEIFEEVAHMVSGYGILCASKPITRQTMSELFSLLSAVRARLMSAEKKINALRLKNEEIRLVGRAKCLLVEHEGLSEPEAHRKIEKSAMDRCVKLGEIANEIINRYKDIPSSRIGKGEEG